WPYLVFQDDGTVVVMGNANQALWFDPSGGGYVPRFNVRQTLLLDAANNVFRLIDLDGSVTEYAAASGAFLRHTDPAGNEVAVVGYTANGFNFTEVQRSYTSGGSTTTESFLYAYVDIAAAFPLLLSITLRRKVNAGSWTNVLKAVYT